MVVEGCGGDAVGITDVNDDALHVEASAEFDESFPRVLSNKNTF